VKEVYRVKGEIAHLGWSPISAIALFVIVNLLLYYWPHMNSGAIMHTDSFVDTDAI